MFRSVIIPVMRKAGTTSNAGCPPLGLGAGEKVGDRRRVPLTLAEGGAVGGLQVDVVGVEHCIEGDGVEVAGDGQFIGPHGGLQVPVPGGQDAVGQHHVGPLLGQEGGGGVVGDHGAGDVLPGQLVGQQGPGGEGGAPLAEGDLLQHLPLPAPADDAQGPGGGGGVEGPPVGAHQHPGALPHQVGAVAADVPVGHHLLPVKGDGGGQDGGEFVGVLGIGLRGILHEGQGGGHIPGAGAGGQQAGLGLVQGGLEGVAAQFVLGGHGGLGIAIAGGAGGHLLVLHGGGRQGLGGLLPGAAGDPLLLPGIGPLVKRDRTPPCHCIATIRSMPPVVSNLPAKGAGEGMGLALSYHTSGPGATPRGKNLSFPGPAPG